MRMNSIKMTLVALGMAAALAPMARAEEVKIGTVDMQKALQTVDAGKKAKAQLEKEFNAKKQEIQNEEASIKKMGDDFKKQSLVMSEEARNKKQGEIQERIMKLQEKTASSQMEIQKKEHELTQPILEKLRKIIADMAKSKGYSVVLEKNENTVLYSVDKDDMTDAVIGAYNKNPS